ncbi:MAG: alpha/beta hydrolase [Pseudomonadota bacterium]
MTWTTQLASKAPGNLASYRSGSGPNLVLLHGVGLRSEAWAPMIAFLKDHFTIHVFDMPGHGQSPLGKTATFKNYVDRLDDAVSQIDEGVTIAGHSMGAMLALELAKRRPEAVRGMAALNAIFRRSPDAKAAVQTRAASLTKDTIAHPDVTLERWFGNAPVGRNELARDACFDWLTSVDPLGYKRAYTAFAQNDGPSDIQLKSMHIPSLFITGAGDPNSTPAMAHAMAARAPKGTAKIFDDAAHMLPMTHPQITAELLIKTFLGGP